MKDDTRYVKTFSRLYQKHNGVRKEKMIPHRRCTPEDFDQFSPIVPAFSKLFNQYKSGKRNLLCLDWENSGKEVEIYGGESDETMY